MRKDPDKYSSLIYHNNTSSNADYINRYYDTAPYGQQQQYPSQNYLDVLIQEDEKLYNKLAKELEMKLFLIMLPAHPHHYRCYP